MRLGRCRGYGARVNGRLVPLALGAALLPRVAAATTYGSEP
jgi:hypothetical protein